jgi:palmitoyltransferase
LERNNRKYFFIYVTIQTIQVIFGLLYTVYVITQISFSLIKIGSYLIILSLLAEIFFTLMLLSLILFHIYLMINNFTTWETLSWNKISYMRVWPRKYGSPFDFGFKKNLQLYFWPKNEGRYLTWKLPKKLPSIETGEKIIENRKWSYLFEKVFIKCQ